MNIPGRCGFLTARVFSVAVRLGNRTYQGCKSNYRLRYICVVQKGIIMKKFVLIVFSFVLFGMLTVSIGQEAFKLGVIDSNRVLQNYKKAMDADKFLKNAEERLRKNLAEMDEDIRTLIEKKEKTELFVEEAQTAELVKQIQAKQLEFQREREQGSQALIEKNRELMQPIFKELEQLIIKTGKEENYDLIIDKQAALYFNEKYDITDKLIILINAGNEKAEQNNQDAEAPKNE